MHVEMIQLKWLPLCHYCQWD